MKASIVLVTWSPDKKRLNLLKNTLKTLEGSTDIPYELIVIDNGGIKEQTEFLKTQKIDKHIINTENLGNGCGRNQGIRVAEGEYIVLIDNDMKFMKDWLKECIEALEKYPNKKLVATALKSSHWRYGKLYHRGMLDEYTLWERSAPGCWVMRRKTLDEIGEFSKNPISGADYCRRLCNNGYRHIMLPKKLVLHMAHRAGDESYDHNAWLVKGEWKSGEIAYWEKIWESKWKMSIKKHHRLFLEIKKYLNGKIVDLACGVTTLYKGGNYNVVGMDMSENAVNKSRKLYPEGHFCIGDVRDTKLPNEEYDTVLLMSIIEHFVNFNPVLLEAKRIAKWGGRIIIVVPISCRQRGHEHPDWNEEKIEKEIGRMLGVISYYKIYEKWWVVVYEKI